MTDVSELKAPVPAAEDYSVSTDLWQQLEKEIKKVSDRIDAGDDLQPEDVINVRELKKQVDNYVTSFNKAIASAQSEYKKMVSKRLSELGFGAIEQFVAKKRQEQTDIQNGRIAYKMGMLKEICSGLLKETKKLKDTVMAKELLPAFTARFPIVQSGAKSNDITDWVPYFSIMSRVITIMDTFFCDPKYEDAVLLPLHAGTIREFLAYARDGKEEHIVNIPTKFEEDYRLIHEEKLKANVRSKTDGMERIKQILEDIDSIPAANDAVKQMKMERAWEEISLIVRLINNK